MRNRDWDRETHNHEQIKKSKREWYHRNKSIVNAINKQNRQRSYAWVVEYKTKHPCPCGESHVAALDFHHLDPSKKEIRVTNAAMRGWSIEKLKQEISKCTVLCSNCHRKLHWNEKHAGVLATASTRNVHNWK
jgi:hypothetical protein